MSFIKINKLWFSLWGTKKQIRIGKAITKHTFLCTKRTLIIENVINSYQKNITLGST